MQDRTANPAGALPDPSGTAVAVPSATTVSAYETTRYFAHAAEPVLLRINDEPQRLQPWLEKMKAHSATIMTAWNPFGEETSAAQNDRAQEQLLSAVRARHLRWLPAAGEDPAGVWQPEPGFCIFDLPEPVLDEWLIIFRQNAAVRAARDSRCHLVWHPGIRPAMIRSAQIPPALTRPGMSRHEMARPETTGAR